MPLLIGWIEASFASAVQMERLKWHISPLCISLVCELLGIEIQPFVSLEMPLACYKVLEISADQGMFEYEPIQRPFWALLGGEEGRN